MGGACRFLAVNLSLRFLISAMCRRARAVSIVPRLVVCHDLHALVAGILLKRLHGCPVIYDSHECWPDADLLSPAWETRYWARFERRYIRQADAVVTVTPQIAEYLKELYRINNVVVVPNACPRTVVDRPSCSRPPGLPVKFLFQGGAAVGRGLDLLLSTWDSFADARTILYVRCPENELLTSLRLRYSTAVERGTVVFLPPVKEEELVTAATFADVGIIPYAPVSRNHAYCCPNKLSQYMQAGLALLASDTAFVGDRVREFDCGLIFQANNADSLAEQVQRLRDHPELLQLLKENAFRHSQTTFHWEQVASPYREAIARLFNRGCEPEARGQAA
jgi:glycosyltransferase involved in cell wall biosynthesis